MSAIEDGKRVNHDLVEEGRGGAGVDFSFGFLRKDCDVMFRDSAVTAVDDTEQYPSSIFKTRDCMILWRSWFFGVRPPWILGKEGSVF